MSEMFNYKIPEEIRQKIPMDFYPAFAKELISIFGIDIFEKDDDDFRKLDWLAGTSGWHMAMRNACSKLGLDWFYTYYDDLKWYDSDRFDGELVDLLIENYTEDL